MGVQISIGGRGGWGWKKIQKLTSGGGRLFGTQEYIRKRKYDKATNRLVSILPNLSELFEKSLYQQL